MINLKVERFTFGSKEQNGNLFTFCPSEPNEKMFALLHFLNFFMNKKIKIAGVIVMTAGLAAASLIAIAATTTTSTPAGTKVQVKSQIAEEKMLRIRGFIDNMENRFNVHIRNLDSLAQRIQNRIDKLVGEGKDMSKVQAKLNEAKTKIQEAKDELAKLKQGVDDMLSSASPKKAFINVKGKLVKAVTAKIKAAHKALVDTIVILRKEAEPTAAATSTIATSTAPIPGASTQQ